MGKVTPKASKIEEQVLKDQRMECSNAREEECDEDESGEGNFCLFFPLLTLKFYLFI